MRQGSSHRDVQRPPWRHSGPSHLYSEDDADAQWPYHHYQHHHQHPPPLSAVMNTNDRPLRPPPMFPSPRSTANASISHPGRVNAPTNSPPVQPAADGPSRRKNGTTTPEVPVFSWRVAQPLAPSAAEMEHVHVQELEEQLQYWRRRALLMEGRVLRRERALKEKYAADFAAAQDESERVIRQLLEKQRTLQQSLQGRTRHMRSSAGSRTSSVMSSASAAAHSVGDGQQYQRQQSEDASADWESERRIVVTATSTPSDPSLRNVDGSCQKSGGSSTTTEKGEAAAALTKRRDELSDALLAQQQQHQQRPPRDSLHSSAASSTGAPCTREATHKDAEVNTLAAPLLSPTDLAALEQQVSRLTQAFLSCLSNAAELRYSCAELIADASRQEDNAKHSKAQPHVVSAGETQHDTRMASIIRTMEAFLVKSEDGQHSTVERPLAQVKQQLSGLHDGVDCLAQQLLTCVDDVLLLQSHRDDEQQRDLRELQEAFESLKRTCARREAEHAQQLATAQAAAEAAATTQRHSRSAESEKALAQARDTIRQLEGRLAVCERELRTHRHTCAKEKKDKEKEEEEERLFAEQSEGVMGDDGQSRSAQLASSLGVTSQAKWRKGISTSAAAAAVAAHEAHQQEEFAGLERRHRLGAVTPHEAAHSSSSSSSSSQDRRHRLHPVPTPSSSFITRARQQQQRQRSTAQPSVTSPTAAEGRSHQPTNARRAEGKVSVAAMPSPAARVAARRDGDEAAATPRRSLSYSPPESAEKKGRRQPPLLGSFQAPSFWPQRPAAQSTEPDEREWEGRRSSVPPSQQPLYVAQPSALIHDEEEWERRGDGAPRSGQRSRTSSSSGDSSASPLARVRAWEEKFKSILTSSE